MAQDNVSGQSRRAWEPEKFPGARVAIIGDAAFVARPHVVAGVTKAAADAGALAQALAICQGNAANALALFDQT